jgi:hypothetical protein
MARNMASFAAPVLPVALTVRGILAWTSRMAETSL